MANRLKIRLFLLAVLVLVPLRSPAPLIYVPGEGWYYESYGESGKWQRSRAKDGPLQFVETRH